MTEKLYYQDAYIKEFSAKVLSCEKCQRGFAVILDRTAFFPESGGQASDVGHIDTVKVTDVQIDTDIITHYAEAPLEVGAQVECRLNFERRFSFMQNHTGEHIISGIVHSLFGLENVGFHLGENFATLDFNEPLSSEQLSLVEYESNRRVWQNLPVRAYFPKRDKLSSIFYRSKKELSGDIRIVEIKDTDSCACCAPHVSTTGQIGIIKLLDTEKLRGGIRIVMKCGDFALKDYNLKYSNILKISNSLSAKQVETADAVEALKQQLTEAILREKELKRRLISSIVDSADRSCRVIFDEGLDIKELQLLADGLHKKNGEICCVFSGDDLSGYSFAMCGDSKELDTYFTSFRKNLSVRGGGRNGMVQGTVAETAEKIKLYL